MFNLFYLHLLLAVRRVHRVLHLVDLSSMSLCDGIFLYRGGCVQARNAQVNIADAVIHLFHGREFRCSLVRFSGQGGVAAK